MSHNPQLCRFPCTKHCKPEREAERLLRHSFDCGGDESYRLAAHVLVEQVEVDISFCQNTYVMFLF